MSPMWRKEAVPENSLLEIIDFCFTYNVPDPDSSGSGDKWLTYDLPHDDLAPPPPVTHTPTSRIRSPWTSSKSTPF